MRHPSARCLVNVADISFPVATPDADGGILYTYPAVTLAGEPCTVQASGPVEDPYTQQRITQVNSYRIMFAQQTSVPARARIDWTDSVGVAHVLFAISEVDEAGRAAAWTVTAIEKE